MTMTLAATDDSAWRLLFEIALSHGESLHHQRITYQGLLVFLRSAELIGPKTSVFPLLVERLWVVHRTLTTSFDSPISDQHVTSSSARRNKFSITSEDAAAPVVVVRDAEEVRRTEVLSHGVVGFEGFTDIMNVISVRCYQTNKCDRIYEEDGKENLKRAIILSAEDRVHLEASVQYTARQYLKAFISRNTVHRKTVVSLDPSLNDWTPYTNQILTHVVSTLQYRVIIPLFARFSSAGQMDKSQFDQFIQAVFPDFTNLQFAAASAVFAYDKFMDVQVWLKFNRFLYLSKTPAGMVVPVGPQPRTLGLDAFVDALLMLSVVAFSDEQRFPHHRAVTSKVWSTFEKYYCPAIKSNMAPDPLYTTQMSAVVPYVSYVYPSKVPVDYISSILIGGINIVMDAECVEEDVFEEAEDEESHPEGEAKRAAEERFQRPGRLIRLVKPSKRAPKQQQRRRGSLSMSSMSPLHMSAAGVDPEEEAATAEQLLPPIGSSSHAATSTTSSKSSPRGQTGEVVYRAAKLFPSTFEKVAYSEYDCPIYGARRCRIYVDDDEAFGIHRGPHHVEVLLPHCTWNMRRFKLSLAFDRDAATKCGRLHFTPVRRLEITLRDKDGEKIYSSVSAVAEGSRASQVLPRHLVDLVEAAFKEKCGSSNSGEGSDDKEGEKEEEATAAAPSLISVRDFVDICRQLKLVRKGVADAMCHSSVRHYKGLLREAGEPVKYREDDSEEKWMTFADCMCAVTCLCEKLSGNTDVAPDVAQFLCVGLSHLTGSIPEAAAADAPAATTTTSDADLAGAVIMPHNGMIDVPYEMAINKKYTAAQDVADGREKMTTLTRSSEALGDDLAAAPGGRKGRALLPDFPQNLGTAALASQYSAYGPTGNRAGLMQTSSYVTGEFLRSEVTIEMEELKNPFLV